MVLGEASSGFPQTNPEEIAEMNSFPLQTSLEASQEFSHI